MPSSFPNFPLTIQASAPCQLHSLFPPKAGGTGESSPVRGAGEPTAEDSGSTCMGGFQSGLEP